MPFTQTWFAKFHHTTRSVLLPQEALLPALEALSPDQFEWAMSLVHARYPGLPTGPGEEMQFDITCLDSLALRQLMDLTQACARAAKVTCYSPSMLLVFTLHLWDVPVGCLGCVNLELIWLRKQLLCMRRFLAAGPVLFVFSSTSYHHAMYVPSATCFDSVLQHICTSVL